MAMDLKVCLLLTIDITHVEAIDLFLTCKQQKHGGDLGMSCCD